MTMPKINQRYAKIVRERYEVNRQSAKAAFDYIRNSTAVCRGEAIPCLYIPKLFTPEAHDHLNNAAQTICTILDKVIQRYLTDPDYRKLFPFSPELEELILLESGYPQLLPIARLDIFFNEDDFSFQFCEFNADGASAMNEDRELSIALRDTDAYLQMQQDFTFTPYEYFDSWVHEFMALYATYNRKVNNPRVIITDFMELGTPSEFVVFAEAFRRAGIEADICEIRDLTYTDGNLCTPDGKRVDAVYRRAVTRDVMDNAAHVQPFIQAARDNAACIVGHFRTQIIHNKATFIILRQPETLAFLTPHEREYVLRHIPETLWLKKGAFDLDGVLANKDAWIIKPDDLYASRGVFAGVDMTPAQWRDAVLQSMDTNYLLQRFVTPYQSDNVDFMYDEHAAIKPYNNITGMFVYNGKLQGLYTRMGLMGMIGPETGNRGVLTLKVEERR